MIVSVTLADNREAEISGALRSVIDVVDYALLIDTGITDRTLERARAAAGSKLVVEQHTWTDFSAARNESLDAAARLGAEWIIIVDSDERIDFSSIDLKRTLRSTKSDVLLVESDDGTYPKEKILRAGSKARFFGPTHEALIGGSRDLLRGATFHELPKSDERLKKKLERDVELISTFLKDYSDDPRWWFYLGLSFESLGKRELAVEAFGQCVLLRKTGHEAAWAAYRQAEQLRALDRHEEAVIVAARGLAADPGSAECACVAAEACLALEKPDRAATWARIAEAIGLYRGHGVERMWFRDPPSLYERPYAVLREAAVSPLDKAEADLEYRSAKLARVRVEHSDLESMSVSRTIPYSNREEARSMLRPKRLVDMCPSARASKISLDLPAGWAPLNPSICRHDGALWCVVRTVNYTIEGRSYTVHDPHRVVRTKNYLGRLNLRGELIDPYLMRDLDESPRQPSQIVGYEDVRLASIRRGSKNVLTGSATVCDRDPNGRRLIARLHFDKRGNVVKSEVQPSNQAHEKNWMPLAVDGKFTWIYSLDPTAILPGPLRKSPLKLEHLRGGAATPFKGGYLCVMHEVIDEEAGRIYLHRFVRLDKKWNVVAVSPSWVFARYGIEFCAGLVYDRGQLILSYGIADQEAWITRVSAKEVEGMRWIKP